MYDDTNWCLVCQCKYFDGCGAYCSSECRKSAQQPSESDDEVIFHHIHDAPQSKWTGNGIIAWASEIPPSSSCSVTSPSSSRPRPLPELMRPYHGPAPPALGITPPPAVIPSSSFPIITPQLSTFCSSLSLESIGKYSLVSPTDSSLATPASTAPLGVPQTKASLLGALATHVRSWVSPTSPLVASSPVVSRDHLHISPTAVKQHQPQPKLTVLAQRHFDDPDTAWRVQTTIMVAEPRSRGRKSSRT